MECWRYFVRFRRGVVVVLGKRGLTLEQDGEGWETDSPMFLEAWSARPNLGLRKASEFDFKTDAQGVLRASSAFVDRDLLPENLVKSSLSGPFGAHPKRSIDKPALLM
ncbi:hypothetical protein TNCV_3616011 [Trichonephila clavipes]|nr:hypothetical protein TNCV_3616011 [Trichonephila clavipes]